ncbi:MAG: hypothetical protein CMO40_01105 [Verrucomicrobiaceae bacterium]|nr:hypothetical protein [Verrucomicrobiaceae bacterium]
MNIRIALVPAILLPSALSAEEADAPAPPSKQVVLKALQWMQSSQPQRRHAAYRSVHLLGKEAIPSFRRALQKARQYHERRLADVLSGRNRGGNPYSELVEVVDELRQERERVYPLMMRDWQKNRQEIDKLRNEWDRMNSLYTKASKLSQADTSTIDKQIDSVTDALVEIHDQLARFEGQTKEQADEISDAERREDALEESFDGSSYMKAARVLGSMRAEVARLSSANQHNDSAAWASAAQKNFARLISYERAVLGLRPLKLEEKLSDSASGHSADMARLGFFSHTSPVPGKRSFSDRARKSGFRGGPSGECIAAGQGSFSAAYGGWFYSDGHRHIMLAKGPNVLGFGVASRHWTLVTGRQ